MDQRCPKICYQKKEDGLTVTACYGIDGQIYLPDELGGEPILSLIHILDLTIKRIMHIFPEDR